MNRFLSVIIFICSLLLSSVVFANYPPVSSVSDPNSGTPLVHLPFTTPGPLIEEPAGTMDHTYFTLKEYSCSSGACTEVAHNPVTANPNLIAVSPVLTTATNFSFERAMGPDGTMSAVKVTKLTNAANAVISYPFTADGASRYSGSLYVKAGTTNKMYWGINTGSWPAQTASMIDGTATVGISSTVRVSDIPETWVRTGTVLDAAPSAGSKFINIYPNGSAADGIGTTMYFWAPQVEPGTSFSNPKAADLFSSSAVAAWERVGAPVVTPSKLLFPKGSSQTPRAMTSNFTDTNYYRIPASASNPYAVAVGQDFYVCSVVKMPIDAKAQMILQNYESNVSGWYLNQTTGGSSTAFAIYPGGAVVPVSVASSASGKLRFVCGGKTDSKIYVYADGTLNSADATGYVPATTQVTGMGKRIDATTYYNRGSIYETILVYGTPSQAAFDNLFKRFSQKLSTTSSPLTVDRNSTGSLSANSDQYLMDTNLPRINPSLGILAEEDRTNLLLYSDSLDTVDGWTAATAVVTANQCRGYDGYLTMDKVARTATTGTDEIVWQDVAAGIVGGPFAFSALVSSDDTASQTVSIGGGCGDDDVAVCSCKRDDGGVCTAVIDNTGSYSIAPYGICYAYADVTTPVRMQISFSCLSASESDVRVFVADGKWGTASSAGGACFGQTQLETISASNRLKPAYAWELDEATAGNAIGWLGSALLTQAGTVPVVDGMNHGNRATDSARGDFSDANYLYYDGSELAATFTGTVSVGLWVFPVTLPGTGEIDTLIAHGASGETLATNTLFGIRLTETGTVVVDWENGSGTDVSTTTTATVVVGTWNHIGVTRTTGTTSTVKIYIDGVLRTTTTGMANPSGGTSGKLFVGDFPDVGLAFAGNIDSVQVYPVALESHGIKQLAVRAYPLYIDASSYIATTTAATQRLADNISHPSLLSSSISNWCLSVGKATAPNFQAGGVTYEEPNGVLASIGTAFTANSATLYLRAGSLVCEVRDSAGNVREDWIDTAYTGGDEIVDARCCSQAGDVNAYLGTSSEANESGTGTGILTSFGDLNVGGGGSTSYNYLGSYVQDVEVYEVEPRQVSKVAYTFSALGSGASAAAITTPPGKTVTVARAMTEVVGGADGVTFTSVAENTLAANVDGGKFYGSGSNVLSWSTWSSSSYFNVEAAADPLGGNTAFKVTKIQDIISPVVSSSPTFTSAAARYTGEVCFKGGTGTNAQIGIYQSSAFPSQVGLLVRGGGTIGGGGTAPVSLTSIPTDRWSCISTTTAGNLAAATSASLMTYPMNGSGRNGLYMYVWFPQVTQTVTPMPLHVTNGSPATWPSTDVTLANSVSTRSHCRTFTGKTLAAASGGAILWTAGTYNTANSESLSLSSAGVLTYRAIDSSATGKVATASAWTDFTTAHTVTTCNRAGDLTITFDGVAKTVTTSGAGSGLLSSQPAVTRISGNIGSGNLPFNGSVSRFVECDNAVNATDCL